ncbi:hypothetical protein C8Q75DRAFT_808705 [Abortiporus biennis]|nr:hypothetical protein C8Q75DRAFT_812093 [Abortiporus biennis]KAI0786315.1 hypothetical protein C8Q75DRAFT_808705 [Abortiporus biennis]
MAREGPVHGRNKNGSRNKTVSPEERMVSGPAVNVNVGKKSKVVAKTPAQRLKELEESLADQKARNDALQKANEDMSSSLSQLEVEKVAAEAALAAAKTLSSDKQKKTKKKAIVVPQPKSLRGKLPQKAQISEEKYHDIQRVVRDQVNRCLDTTVIWKHQNKYQVSEFIHECNRIIPWLTRYERDWLIIAIALQYLGNRRKDRWKKVKAKTMATSKNTSRNDPKSTVPDTNEESEHSAENPISLAQRLPRPRPRPLQTKSKNATEPQNTTTPSTNAQDATASENEDDDHIMDIDTNSGENVDGGTISEPEFEGRGEDDEDEESDSELTDMGDSD